MFRHPLFSDVFALRDTVDRFINESVGSDPHRTVWSREANGTSAAQPMPLDVYATEDKAVILAAVPGMQPDDLDLAIHENTVTMSGRIASVTQADETKGATWYAHELWSGEVRRSVTLPFPIDADRAEAVFENGILRVVLPKAESAKPRRISITSGQQRTAISSGTNSGESQS
jgi:HSP20 family protein